MRNRSATAGDRCPRLSVGPSTVVHSIRTTSTVVFVRVRQYRHHGELDLWR
jgi:hypothetical protein